VGGSTAIPPRPPEPPSPGQRHAPRPRASWAEGNGPANTVVAGRFLTSVGYFLVLPFLTVYLTRRLGMTVAQASLLFAALILTRRGLGIAAGWASDAVGAVRVLVAGLLIEALAYAGFAASTSFWIWLLGVAMLGAGGSLNNMGSRSLLATPSRAALNFSRYYLGVNAAALIGPMVGAVLLAQNLARVSFLVAGGLHALFAGLTWITLHSWTPQTAGTGRTRGIASALRDRALLGFCALAVGYWFFDALLFVALPLTIDRQRLPVVLLGPLNALNAIICMAALWLLGEWVNRRGPGERLDLLAASGVVLGIGWLACAVTGLPAIVVAMVVVAVGDAVFLSVVDALAASLAPPGRTGLYLGIATLAWAAGGVLGSLAAGAFAVAARGGWLTGYWAGIAAVGLATAGATRLARPGIAQAITNRQPVAGC
jgi:DHA1 family multidrug resistance protein-like MFS transporter